MCIAGYFLKFSFNFARSVTVARSSAVQASSSRRQEVVHRLWLPAVAVHRLGVVEIAPSPHHLTSLTIVFQLLYRCIGPRVVLEENWFHANGAVAKDVNNRLNMSSQSIRKQLERCATGT